jgi:hypothetical protein
MFVLYVFPDSRGVSDWIIYFTTSRIEARTTEEERQKVLGFLKGTLPDKRIRLREFALCYPQSKNRTVYQTRSWSFCVAEA